MADPAAMTDPSQACGNTRISARVRRYRDPYGFAPHLPLQRRHSGDMDIPVTGENGPCSHRRPRNSGAGGDIVGAIAASVGAIVGHAVLRDQRTCRGACQRRDEAPVVIGI